MNTKAISKKDWEKVNEQEWNSHWLGLLSSGNAIAYDLTKAHWERHIEVMDLPKAGTSLGGKRILDLGGGLFSLLYNYSGRGRCLVVDPLPALSVHIQHYLAGDIVYIQEPAEEFLESFKTWEKFDEVWIYNCLQHTINPEAILKGLPRVANLLRISEPIDTPVNDMHPHTFSEEDLLDAIASIATGEYRTCKHEYLHAGGVFTLKS